MKKSLPTREELRDNYYIIITTHHRNPTKSIGGIPLNRLHILGQGFGINITELIEYRLLQWIHEDSQDYQLELRKR